MYILPKKVQRIMTFSMFSEPSSPIFENLHIIKLCDLVTLNIALFTYKFHNSLFPSVFISFFKRVNTVHNYNTRLSSKLSYTLPKEPIMDPLILGFKVPKCGTL